LKDNVEIPQESLRSSLLDLAVFYKCFSTLLQSGVPIIKALQVCSESASLNFGSVLVQMEMGLSKGRTLWHCMRDFPHAFRRHEVEMLAAGGATGQLVVICGYLARATERERDLRMELQKALFYPCFVALLSFSAVVFLPPYIFGPLFEFLQSTGTNLPGLTRAVYGFSKLVGRPEAWMLVLVLGMLAFGFCKGLPNRPGVRIRLEEALLMAPLVGPMLRNLIMTRFANVFSLALSVGLSFQKCCQLAGHAGGSILLEKRMVGALEMVQQGKSLKESLESTQLFSGIFLAFIETGSQTGRLADLMERSVTIIEEELRHQVDQLLNLLEPLALLFMGGVVGVFVLAAMIPMTQVLESL
jgi:type IV pilus assembly protein PilC